MERRWSIWYEDFLIAGWRNQPGRPQESGRRDRAGELFENQGKQKKILTLSNRDSIERVPENLERFADLLL